MTALDGAGTLNDLFGYSVETWGSGPSVNVAPVGSSFRGGPAALPDNDGSTSFTIGSLPAGAVSQYNRIPDEDSDDPEESSTVITVVEGKGTVVSLAWYWYDAAPGQVEGQDGGWNAFLDTSVRTGI